MKERQEQQINTGRTKGGERVGEKREEENDSIEDRERNKTGWGGIRFPRSLNQ